VGYEELINSLVFGFRVGDEFKNLESLKVELFKDFE